MPLCDRALSLAENLAAWAAENPGAGVVLGYLARARGLLREAAETPAPAPAPPVDDRQTTVPGA